MTARKIVAAALEEHLPSYAVDAYPTSPAHVRAGTPYVDVYETDMDGFGEDMQLRHELTVNVMVSAGATEATAEDALETARDNVLVVLTQHCEGVFIQSCKRVNFMSDTYPGYAITANAYSNDPYQEAQVQI